MPGKKNNETVAGRGRRPISPTSGIPNLFADLALAHSDGRYARIQRALGGVQLLIPRRLGLPSLSTPPRTTIGH